ncbi:MAG: SpoIIE family protein phosphatase [Lachnospiraceae bacterium]|nr:SpoIIE family protein phosphatase [Lachnospiraceae bacterium]
MKKVMNLVLGGLQQKIFNLVLIVILLMIGVYAAVSTYQVRNVARIVEETGVRQRDSIAQTTDKVMNIVVERTLADNSAMKAELSDHVFAQLTDEVLALRDYAQILYTMPSAYSAHPVERPDASKNGEVAAQLVTAAGVDPESPEILAQVELLGNMSEMMCSVYGNVDQLNSCFVGTPDGVFIIADDRPAVKLEANGEVKDYPVTERPWYIGAVEAGDIYYTGVEEDAFTKDIGIVCAAPVYVDGELVAVVGADLFLNSMAEAVNASDEQGGFECVINHNGQVIFSPKQEGTFTVELADEAQDLRTGENEELAELIRETMEGNNPVKFISVDGEKYYVAGAPIKTVGWVMLTALDEVTARSTTTTLLEQYDEINEVAYAQASSSLKKGKNAMLILLAVVMFLGAAAALALAKQIVKPLEHMTNRIRNIGGDDLQFKMEDAYRTGDEIEVLAEGFADLSAKTLQYVKDITAITAEKERIGTELGLARKIQANMLPNIFPAFPDRDEFDIYAAMTPAKEVGGDFYDYFMIDDDHLGLVMADVSDKGVPAALFMMMSKILLNNYAMMGEPPAKVLERANNQICGNNVQEMFVTVWFGILTISTGKIVAANAGHEYPIIRHAGGEFELFKDIHGLVVGGVEGVHYKEYEINLSKGDVLFLYTDGVAEATSEADEQFGTKRMLEALNADPEACPKQLLVNMKAAVDAFAGKAPQFDDLTMLALKLVR